MKQTAAVLFTIFLTLLCLPAAAAAGEESTGGLVESSGIYAIREELDKQTKEMLESIGLDSIKYDNILSFDVSSLSTLVKQALQPSISGVVKVFTAIAAAVILCAFAAAFSEGFSKLQGGQMYRMCMVLFAAAVCVPALLQTLAGVQAAVKSAAAFTVAAVPILCVIFAAQGRAVSAAVFNGAAVGVSQIISSLFVTFFMPIASVLTALGLISGLDSDMQAGEGLRLARKYLSMLLGGLATLYFGALGLKAAVGTAADASAVKALKLASGSFVPVIGSAISDSAGVVIASLELTKSTIGAFGIVVCVCIFLPGMLQCFLWYACFEAAALLGSVFSMQSVQTVFKSLAAAASMFLIIELFCALIFIMNFGLMLSVKG